jgi:hypothetical protein
MLRATFALVSAVVLNVAYSQAQNEKPTRSLEEDKKVLTASKWQNEKPEAAWNKLSDNFKSQCDWKPWKKVELEIMKLGDGTDPQGCTHHVQPSFLKPDDEKVCFGFTSVEIREEKGKRFLVMTNLDKVAYKIEYEFKGGKLQDAGFISAPRTVLGGNLHAGGFRWGIHRDPTPEQRRQGKAHAQFRRPEPKSRVTASFARQLI